MNFCTENGVLIAFKVIGYLVFIIKIIVPLILIILGIFDFASALISNDEKGIKEAIPIFIRRFIAAVIIFFIPTILNFVINLVDGANELLGSFTNCTSCLLKPIACSTKTIGSDLKEQDKTETTTTTITKSSNSNSSNNTKSSISNSSEAINNTGQNIGNTAADSINSNSATVNEITTKETESSNDKNLSIEEKVKKLKSSRSLTKTEGYACLKSNNAKYKILSCSGDTCFLLVNSKVKKYEKNKLYSPPCGEYKCTIIDKKIIVIYRCSNSKCYTDDNVVYSQKSFTSDLTECLK